MKNKYNIANFFSHELDLKSNSFKYDIDELLALGIELLKEDSQIVRFFKHKFKGEWDFMKNLAHFPYKNNKKEYVEVNLLNVKAQFFKNISKISNVFKKEQVEQAAKNASFFKKKSIIIHQRVINGSQNK